MAIDFCNYLKYTQLYVKIKSIKKNKEMPYEEKVAFFNQIDHQLYSEVNTKLFEKIVNMFDLVCTNE